MLLLLFLILLLALASYGGVALSPLLWIAVAIVLLAIVLGPVMGRWGRW